VVIFDTPLTDAEKLPLDHTDENTSRPVGGIASFFLCSFCMSCRNRKILFQAQQIAIQKEEKQTINKKKQKSD